MGPSLQVCLDELDTKGGRKHAAGDAGELHILERTSLKFLAQNCIVASAPNLTRFKISGSLPTLQVNFSDRKYKSLMRMIDVALPKFDDPNAPPPSRPSIEPAARHTSFARSRSRVPGDGDEDLTVGPETDDEASDGEREDGEDKDDKDDQDDKFYEVPDIADGVRFLLICRAMPSRALSPG